MMNWTVGDLEKLTDEEFEKIELQVEKQIATMELNNMWGIFVINWDDQHIGQNRREMQALEHPAVDADGVRAFRAKAVVDNLEGNSLVHPLTTAVTEVSDDCTKARAVYWGAGYEGLAKFREKPMPIFTLGGFNNSYVRINGEWKILDWSWQRTTKNEYHSSWVHDMQPTNTRPALSPEEDRALLGRYAYQKDEVKKPVPEPPRKDTFITNPDITDKEWIYLNTDKNELRGSNESWFSWSQEHKEEA